MRIILATKKRDVIIYNYLLNHETNIKVMLKLKIDTKRFFLSHTFI